jgi:hypothetical protein
MSKKIEKLREVNAMITALLNEMETRMFIEGINAADVREKSKNDKSKNIVTQKQ